MGLFFKKKKRTLTEENTPLIRLQDGQTTYGLKLYEHNKNSLESDQNAFIFSYYINGKPDYDVSFEVTKPFHRSSTNPENIRTVYLNNKNLLAEQIAIPKDCLGADFFIKRLKSLKNTALKEGRPLLYDKTDYHIIAECSTKRNDIRYFGALREPLTPQCHLRSLKRQIKIHISNTTPFPTAYMILMSILRRISCRMHE